MLHALEEDVHRPVGRATARRGTVRDESGVAYAASVDTVFEVVVVGQELPGHLGNSVYGGGSRDGVLRCRVLGRAGTEDPDGAGG